MTTIEGLKCLGIWEDRQLSIKELVEHQTEWESARAISNGNWGVDRIQEEVDEAREEEDLYKKLVEIADVIIIAAGSAGSLIKYLDLESDALEKVIRAKLAINDEKYPLTDDWDHINVEEQMARCKDNWLV